MPTVWEAYIGPLAGVTTSILWTATSLFFTAAGRRLGPTVVNATRIGVAILLLGVTHRLLNGVWLPNLHSRQVWFLACSGILGLSIGDQALMTAFMDIGPRLAMLIMTTSPLIAALFGWVVLGERLHALAWIGIAMTLSGVAWVVGERPAGPVEAFKSLRIRGVVLALVGALCQAGGLLLSKQGMGHGWLPVEQHVPPQTATLTRMAFAGIGMLPIVLLNQGRQRWLRARGVHAVRMGTNAGGVLLACCGAVTGPFLGVWMSLVATDRAPLGVAQTLCSLAPVFLLPTVAILFREGVSFRAVVGAVMAVAGAALLFIH